MSQARTYDPVEELSDEDFASPAELFVSRRAGTKRGGLGYHRFETAADAIDYAVEEFSKLRPDDLVMTIDNKRFNLGTLRALHRDGVHRAHVPASEPTE